VTSGWRRILTRLSQTGWDELKTRGGQELHKRFDLAQYRVGLQRPSDGLAPAGSWRTFFISPDEMTRRVSLLKQNLPAEVEKIIREADDICRHRFSLLGYENLDYGSQIDWHLDVVHGKRAPLKPWFKIDFLNFSEVGDHKIIWELNRHQHLVTLAKAWRLTQRERYVTELLDQLSSWRRANPYPLGINWGSSLEVAFRSFSWLWVYYLVADCPTLSADFAADLSQGLAQNGRYIERYLSTYFSPNTHLLGEAVALLWIGTFSPQLSSAARWRDKGWRIVLEESERQIRADGMHFEQSLYYHVYAFDFFFHARLAAAHNGWNIPADFDRTLEKMLGVLAAISQAGPPQGFGDDDGGRVFNPRRNRAEHLTDPLAIGAVIFQQDEIKAAATLTEEAVWLLGERAVSLLCEPHPRDLGSNHFEASGIYVMAGSKSSPLRMVIDAGPQGTGRSGHGHADALSITMSLDGRPWLVDPGTFCYISADNGRESFRGTGAHNTLRIDGQDQAVPEGPFAWSSIPKIRVDQWLTGATFSLFAGSHTGYCRLPDPVVHRRLIFHLHGSLLLVRDVAEASDLHQLELNWHFAPDLTVSPSGNAFIAAPSQRPPGGMGQPRLALVPREDASWTSELESGEFSPVYGRKEPAPIVRLTANVKLPADFATLIVPLFSASDKPGRFISLSRSERPEDNESVHGFRYDEETKTHYLIFADDKKRWSLGEWSSDAGFLYYRLENRRLAHLILCGAAFAKWQRKDVLTHPVPVERFEWLRNGETGQIFSSDETAVQSLSEGLLESFETVF
jgi:Heparinase II/III-like protein/Heparinase II/III N-terminus